MFIHSETPSRYSIVRDQMLNICQVFLIIKKMSLKQGLLCLINKRYLVNTVDGCAIITFRITGQHSESLHNFYAVPFLSYKCQLIKKLKCRSSQSWTEETVFAKCWRRFVSEAVRTEILLKLTSDRSLRISTVKRTFTLLSKWLPVTGKLIK